MVFGQRTAGIGQKATANPSMIIRIAQEDITLNGSETRLDNWCSTDCNILALG